MWGSMATTLQLYSECHGLYITASNHEHLNMSPVVLKIDTYFLFYFPMFRLQLLLESHESNCLHRIVYVVCNFIQLKS